TRFTEVGYVGRDVEFIVHDLVDTSLSQVYEKKLLEVEGKAEKVATEKIISYLYHQVMPRKRRLAAKRQKGIAVASNKQQAQALASSESPSAKAGMDKRYLARLLNNHKLDEELIEIEVSVDAETPFMDYRFGFYGYDGGEFLGIAGDREKEEEPPVRRRKVKVREAKRILFRQEANKLIDFDDLHEEALKQAENNGVVFIDELDKLAAPSIEVGRDISGEGVQRDLLPIVEGTSVLTRYGPMKTDHILFIGAGTFYRSKPSDLIPELQGRFPLRVELKSLTRNDMERILTEPNNSLCKQYEALLATEGLELTFAPDGIKEITRLAELMNEQMENIGARRLHTIMEKVLEDANFNATDKSGEKVTVDAGYVSDHIGDLIKNQDLGRYIL
ncbi:MAG: ATP-dependent protease ATPase subunit HslU, partial [Dehalococcoidia bacterium]|nr:ATP-dependent protease ATPase subunit HslU [Dehalococcoidia bacterium]